MRKNNKRADILDAALRVVENKGANHLTIDAVAAESGFSKGGVLYHFGSKKALLSGMLDHLIENIRSRSDDSQPNASIQFGVRMSATEKRASLALLAAAAEDPELLAPARAYICEAVKGLTKDTDDPLKAITLFLANEGLRFLEILELNPLSQSETDRVLQNMVLEAEQL